jgi:putative phosphoribosyl transferase
MTKLPFRDRVEAGRLLAAKIASCNFNFQENTIVLGLPRGGVVIGSAIATALRVPLDIVVVRKLGAPFQPELAIGAVAGSRIRVLDEDLIAELCVPSKDVEAVVVKEMEEVERRERLYRNERPAPDLHDWTVILADDGLATGSSMMAAVEYVNSFRPTAVIVAVPVGSAQGCDRLKRFVTDCVCLAIPEPFDSVGAWYKDFRPITDQDVCRLLEEQYRRTGPPLKTIRLTPQDARML